MKVHIARAHGTREPVGLEKPIHEETHSPLGSVKTIANNDRFNWSVRGFKRDAINKVSKSLKICPGSDIIDQCYQAALEIEENRNKIKKINEILGQFPLSAVPRINAEPLNYSSEITPEPPILPAETPFQKKYCMFPSIESNTANDCDMRRTTESHWTAQEKPKRLTFDEFRKIRPGLTFDEFRKIVQTPVTDREYARSGKGWVRRNLFGEIVDFGICF